MPIIDPNFLSHDEDIHDVLCAVDFAKILAKTKAISNIREETIKNDLLNVREIIEKEMHQEVTDPLFLTDIISIDENKTDKNKLLQSSNINLLIKNVIKDIIAQELKIWLEKNLSSTISPILRDYLHNSRKNPSSQNKRKLTKDINAQPKVKIKTKLNKRNFEQMTLEELQKEVVNKGIKLDKRNGKKTLISLLSKS